MLRTDIRTRYGHLRRRQIVRSLELDPTLVMLDSFLPSNSLRRRFQVFDFLLDLAFHLLDLLLERSGPLIQFRLKFSEFAKRGLVLLFRATKAVLNHAEVFKNSLLSTLRRTETLLDLEDSGVVFLLL